MATSPFDQLYRTTYAGTDATPPVSAVHCRVARTLDELKAALHLVYLEYVQRGYIQPNPPQLKLSLFQALPSTTTFVAVHDQGLVGTLSLIVDSPLGLPMDEAYKPELDALRRQGHQLAEASLLSFDTSLSKQEGLSVFDADRLMLTLRLFKSLLDYARQFTTATDIVACFHPRHRSVYDFIHLEPLGSLKSYSAVNGNPAVAARFHIPSRQAMSSAYPVLRFAFGQADTNGHLDHKFQPTEEHLRHLFVYSSNVFASASASEMAYVQRCHPGYTLYSPAARPAARLPKTLHADGALDASAPLAPPERPPRD